MKKLGMILAAAMFVGLTGCGSDSHAPSTVLSYVARGSSDSYAPHLFTLNPASKVSTAVSIPINTQAEFVSANSQATEVTYCYVPGSQEVPDIFTMGTNGTENQLTTDADACESVFSPDGKTIGYVSYPQDGTYGIYTMNADGSNQQGLFLPTEDDAYEPQFSPDGKSLVFYIVADCGCDRDGARFHGSHQSLKGAPHSSWEQAHLRSQKSKAHGAVRPQVDPTTSGWYTMSLTGGTPTLVYATENWWGPASFSADGTSILFTMYDGEENNIATVNLDGTGYTPLTTSNGDVASFSPVAYGGFIFFNVTDDTNSSWDIYVMDQSGSNQVLVSSTANTYETLIDSYWEED